LCCLIQYMLQIQSVCSCNTNTTQQFNCTNCCYAVCHSFCYSYSQNLAIFLLLNCWNNYKSIYIRTFISRTVPVSVHETANEPNQQHTAVRYKSWLRWNATKFLVLRLPAITILLMPDFHPHAKWGLAFRLLYELVQLSL
jgi:hypothetical protein